MRANAKRRHESVSRKPDPSSNLVPTFYVGMPLTTLCVVERFVAPNLIKDAKRPGMRANAKRRHEKDVRISVQTRSIGTRVFQ